MMKTTDIMNLAENDSDIVYIIILTLAWKD
jgi:hypothetical protein